MEKCRKVGKSGKKVGKSGEKWEKVGKVWKSGEKWGKVGKSGEKWGKVGKSWNKWGKVGKSRWEKEHTANHSGPPNRPLRLGGQSQTGKAPSRHASPAV